MDTTTHEPLPRTTTIKQIPDPLYQRLKASAKRNRRSLNQEMIVCIDRGLQAGATEDGLSPVQRVERLMEHQQGVWVDPDEVVAIIRADRDRDHLP
ncbi:MAG: hypothetical protein EXR79_08745 [Myxococcales bacterium]|nr:hypothetical protein [Myxococcales bacterium]